jgi:hypothetical protein
VASWIGSPVPPAVVKFNTLEPGGPVRETSLFRLVEKVILEFHWKFLVLTGTMFSRTSIPRFLIDPAFHNKVVNKYGGTGTLKSYNMSFVSRW